MAKKKQLLAYPITEELKYRDRINPDVLNKMIRSIKESVLRAMLKHTEAVEMLTKLNLGVISSYRAFSGHDARFDQFPENVSGVAFASSFDTVEAEGTENPGRTDTLAGIHTLDWINSRKMSKIPRVDGLVSPSVEIYVDDILRVAEDDAYSCLDRRNDSLWIESTATADHTLELRLPPSLNKKFNYLEIVPFPVFGIEITKVVYYDEQSREHDILPQSDKVFYNNSGPLIFHLKPRAFNNTIKIWYTVKDGVGAMGFSNIDVALIDYYNTEQTAYIPFNIPSTVTNIVPTSAELDFYVDGTTEYNSYITEVSIVSSIGGSNLIDLKPTHEIQNDLGAVTIDASGGLYLKIKIKEVDMTTPVIRGCQLNYNEV